MRDEERGRLDWVWLSCKSLDADGFFAVHLLVHLLATSDDFPRQINAHELSPPFLGAESNPECFIPIFPSFGMRNSDAVRDSKVAQRLTGHVWHHHIGARGPRCSSLGLLIFQVVSFIIREMGFVGFPERTEGPSDDGPCSQVHLI